MHHSPAPFTTYLDLYQKYPKDVLSRKARQLEWDMKDDTVLTTWEISFSAVQKKMPEAATILLISGNLAPEGIAQSIFTFGGFFSGMSNSSTIISRLLIVLSPELQVQQAIGILLSFSFVQRSVGASYVSVHPLIHLWARLRLNLFEQSPTYGMRSAGNDYLRELAMVTTIGPTRARLNVATMNKVAVTSARECMSNVLHLQQIKRSRSIPQTSPCVTWVSWRYTYLCGGLEPETLRVPGFGLQTSTQSLSKPLTAPGSYGMSRVFFMESH